MPLTSKLGTPNSQLGFTQILGFDPGVIYYFLRAQDSGCVPVTYVEWVATEVGYNYPGTLPCGGPLVNLVVILQWGG